MLGLIACIRSSVYFSRFKPRDRRRKYIWRFWAPNHAFSLCYPQDDNFATTQPFRENPGTRTTSVNPGSHFLWCRTPPTNSWPSPIAGHAGQSRFQKFDHGQVSNFSGGKTGHLMTKNLLKSARTTVLTIPLWQNLDITSKSTRFRKLQDNVLQIAFWVGTPGKTLRKHIDLCSTVQEEMLQDNATGCADMIARFPC